jgi:hypothetical protein
VLVHYLLGGAESLVGVEPIAADVLHLPHGPAVGRSAVPKAIVHLGRNCLEHGVDRKHEAPVGLERLHERVAPVSVPSRLNGVPDVERAVQVRLRKERGEKLERDVVKAYLVNRVDEGRDRNRKSRGHLSKATTE